MTVSTLEEAAAWVDRVGLALVFPKDDLVLPSLWYAAGGADRFSERDESGEFVRWVAPMDFVWGAKSALPGRGLCCGGNHLRGRASLISHELLPALVAATPRDEPNEVEREVLDVLESAGPTSARELPELLPHRERKTVRAALDRLQRRLVVTNAGLEEEADRWPANVVDLVDRRYADRLRELPDREDARRTLAERAPLGGRRGLRSRRRSRLRLAQEGGRSRPHDARRGDARRQRHAGLALGQPDS